MRHAKHGLGALGVCLVLKGKESKGCKPKEPIVANGIGEGFLHPVKELTYLIVKPDQGNRFTTLEFNEETCALPNAEIGGEIVGECLNEKLETMEEASGHPDLCLEEAVHHLVQEAKAPRSLFKLSTELKYGANPAFIDGIADAFLTGTYEGKKWSGHV